MQTNDKHKWRAAAGVFTCPAYRYFLLSILTVVFAVAFISCSEDRATSSYNTHPVNWMDEYSEDWHGKAALPSKGESCLGCHAISTSVQSFDDGPVTAPEPMLAGCYDCHNYPHGDNYVPQHHTDIRAAGWQNMNQCQACHGVNFSGGRAGASCLECHTLPGGPGACNTCHGYPPTTTRPLPGENPGAHFAHVRYACTECHNTVTGLNHIGPLPAEVEFDDARISTSRDYPASYTASNCATYCHSNLSQGGPIVPVQWKTGQTLNACRSCHQVPPSTPTHPAEMRCHLCHLNVDPASNYNDANQIRFLPGDTLHVNGVVNAIFE